MELLFLPFQLLIAVPGLPFVPALGLWVLAARRWNGLTAWRRVLVFGGVAAWVAYAVWESIMYVWMQTVIAPSRLDLLLIVPLLYLCARHRDAPVSAPNGSGGRRAGTRARME